MHLTPFARGNSGTSQNKQKTAKKHKQNNMDIFDNAILCRKCKKEMHKDIVSRNGFNLRIIKCDKCGEIIVHPADKQEYENFMKLKNKEFEVKMRMVGNSYAVSIPREIVDFMKEQETMINNMVKMSFEDAGRLKLMFNTPEQDTRSRVVKAREVRIVKNNRPVFHSRQFYDSAHPEKTKNIVLKAKKSEEDLEEEL